MGTRFGVTRGKCAAPSLAAIAFLVASVAGCGTTPTPTPEDWSSLPKAVDVVPLLWLRADSMSGALGSPVASWPADPGPAAAQSDPARQPTLAKLGDRAAVRFDGVDDMLESNLNVNPSAHPTLTIVAVFSSDTNARSPLRKLYGADDGDYDRAVGLDDRASDGRNYTVFAGPEHQVAGYFDLEKDTAYLTVDQFVAGSFDGWVNGHHALLNQRTNAQGDGLRTFFVGGTGTVFSEPWEGTVAELLAFDSVLSEPQRAALEDFLGRKYVLTVVRP
jgi:hypothetical protein